MEHEYSIEYDRNKINFIKATNIISAIKKAIKKFHIKLNSIEVVKYREIR